MRRRWRVWLLILVLLAAGIIELLSGHLARAIAHNLLVFGTTGWKVSYRSVHFSVVRRQLRAESLTLTPIGAHPSQFSFKTTFVTIAKCSHESVSGYCTKAEKIQVTAELPPLKEGAEAVKKMAPSFRLVANGSAQSVYDPRGSAQFYLSLDNGVFSSHTLAWSGNLRVSAIYENGQWNASAFIHSGDPPSAAAQAHRPSPLLSMEFHGSPDGWSVLATGGLLVYSLQDRGQENARPVQVNNIRLTTRNKHDALMTELVSLEAGGVHLQGLLEYRQRDGQYKGHVIAKGPLIRTATQIFGASLTALGESEQTRWELKFDGNPTGVRIHWNTEPGLSVFQISEKVTAGSIQVETGYPGEPDRIRSLLLTAGESRFVGTGVYDNRTGWLSLSGTISYHGRALPAILTPIHLVGSLELRLLLSPYTPSGEVVLSGCLLKLSDVLSFNATSRVRWDENGFKGEASVNNQTNSLRFTFLQDTIRVEARGTDTDLLLEDLFSLVTTSRQPLLRSIWSDITLSDYEIRGNYDVAGQRLTADLNARLTHPDARLRATTHLTAVLEDDGWHWQANSQDVAVSIRRGPEASGQFKIIGGTSLPSSGWASLEGVGLSAKAEWSRNLLRAEVRGKEQAPRAVSLVTRIFPAVIPPQARLLLNQTQLTEFAVTVRHDFTTQTPRVEGKLSAFNDLLNISLDIKKFEWESFPDRWTALATFVAEGEGFNITGESVRFSPSEFSGKLRVTGHDLDLSSAGNLVRMIYADAQVPAWLAGTLSGWLEVEVVSPQEGQVLLEIREWDRGPLNISDIWLNGALLDRDLTLSGTSKIGGVPVNLAVALSRFFEPSREGLLVVSAEHLTLSDLRFIPWPDYLKRAVFSGYAQATVSEVSRTLSGMGVLTGLASGWLPPDLRVSVEGDFSRLSFRMESADSSVSAKGALELKSPYPLTGEFSARHTGTFEPFITRWNASLKGAALIELSPFRLRSLETTIDDFHGVAWGQEWLLEDPLQVRTRNGTHYEVGPFVVASEVGRISGEGNIVQTDAIRLHNARLEGVLPLTALEVFAPEAEATGNLNFRFLWGDEPSRYPDEGTFALEAKSIVHPSLPEPLYDVFLSGSIDDSLFRLGDGRFMFSDGDGTVTGGGVLSSAHPEYFSFNLTLNHFRIPYPVVRDSYARTSLRITGTVDEMLISGDMEVSSGWIDLSGATTPASMETPVPMHLNISLSVAEGVRVVSSVFQAGIQGTLALRGTLDSPLVYGDLTLQPPGVVKVAGKSFTLQSGSARFTGYSLLPEISATAVREETPYTIYLQASGIPPDLRAELTSSPPLTTPSILSVLATGRTLEEIQSATGDSAGVLTLGLQGLISVGLEEHWFDRVSTRSATIGGRKLPVMTLGKAIGDRYFAQYSFDTSSGAPEEISFSYRMRPWEFQVIQRKSESPALTVTYRGASYVPGVSEPIIQYTVSSVALRIPEDKQLEQDLLKAIPFRQGDRVNLSQIAQLRVTLRKLLVQRDLLAARVSVTTFMDEESGSVAVSVVVEPGKIRKLTIQAPEGLKTNSIAAKLSAMWEFAPTDDAFLRSATRSLPALLEDEGWLLDQPLIRLEEGQQIEAVITLRATPLPRIDEVRVSADPSIEIPSTVRRFLRKGALWRPIGVRKILEEWERTERARGYRDFRAIAIIERLDPPTPQLPPSFTVLLKIKKENLYRIGEVYLEPPELANPALESAIADVLTRDRTASVPNIISLRQRIAQIFREKGYASVYVAIREKSVDASRVDLIVHLDVGAVYVVKDIALEGRLSRSERANFERLLKPFENRTLTPSLESELRNTLRKSGFPSAYEIRVETKTGEAGQVHATLRVRLVPAPPLTYGLSAGFGSGTGLVLSGSALRQGVVTPWQSVGFSGQWSRDLRNAEITFADPRFQFRDYSARFRLFAERAVNSDLVVHTRLGGIEITRVSEPARTQITGSLQVQRLTYSGTLARSPDTAVTLNLALIRDRRDSLFNPTRGDLFSFSLKLGQVLPPRAPIFGRATLHLVHAQPLSPSVSLFSRLFLGYGFQLPLGEMFFYTSALGVRGFNPDRLNPRDPEGDPVGGHAFALAGIESRWRFQRRLGALAFVDTGGNFENLRDLRIHQIALSAGAGLFYVSPLGPIRFEYQVPIKPEDRAGKNELFIGFAFAY
ncbi:MAG: translocation/assembly module TamB domain-containing protein [bacterium JZ-2024 1]